MKDFKALISKIKEDIKIIKETNKESSLENYNKVFVATVEKNGLVNNLISKVLQDKNEAFNRQLINNIIINDGNIDRENLASFFSSVISSVDFPSDMRTEYGEKVKNFKKDQTMPCGELIDALFPQNIDEENKDKILKSIYSTFTSFYSFKYNNYSKEEDVDMFASDFSKLGIDLDNYSKHVQTEGLTIYTTDFKNQDLPMYNDEIDGIIAGLDKSVDGEYLEALETSKGILIQGVDTYIYQSSSQYENYGNIVDAKERGLVDNICDKINKEGPILIKDVMPLIDSNVSEQKRIELFEGAKEQILSQEEIDVVIDIIDDIEDKDVYDENVITESLGNGKYKFAFTQMKYCKIKLEDGIKNKNREDIIKYSSEYKKAEQKYDNIINKIKKNTDSNLTVGNNANSRENDVPAKYRNDGVNVAKFNSFYEAYRTCKDFNVNIKDLVNNPITTMLKFSDNVIAKDKQIENIDRINDSRQLLKYIVDNNDDMTIGSLVYNQTSARIAKVFDAVACFIKGENKRVKYKFNTNLVFNNILNNELTTPSHYLDGTNLYGDFLANKILTCGEVGFVDCYKEGKEQINKESFESFQSNKVTEYISNKYNQAKIVKNILSAKEFLKSDEFNNATNNERKGLKKSFNKSVEKYSQVDVDRSEIVNDIIDKYNRNKKISKTDRKNLDLEINFNKMYKGNINAENKDSVINAYLDVKDAYNSRNFLAKIFYSSVRRQSRMLDGMMKILKDGGVTTEDITQIENNRLGRGLIREENQIQNSIENNVQKSNEKNVENEVEEHIEFKNEFDTEKNKVSSMVVQSKEISNEIKIND